MEMDCSCAAATGAGLARNGASPAPRRNSLIRVRSLVSSRGRTVTRSEPAAELFQPAVSPASAAVVPKIAATSIAAAATAGDRRINFVGIGSLATSASRGETSIRLYLPLPVGRRLDDRDAAS